MTKASVIGIDNNFALIRVVGEFLAGCFLYQIFSTGKLKNLPWSIISFLTSTLIIFIVILFSSAFTNTFSYSINKFAFFFLILLYTILIFSLAHEKGKLALWLGSPKMVFWGEASYSLYMIHAIVLMITVKILPAEHFIYYSILLRAGIFIFIFAMMFLISALTFTFIEKPSRIKLRNLTRPKQIPKL